MRELDLFLAVFRLLSILSFIERFWRWDPVDDWWTQPDFFFVRVWQLINAALRTFQTSSLPRQNMRLAIANWQLASFTVTDLFIFPSCSVFLQFCSSIFSQIMATISLLFLFHFGSFLPSFFDHSPSSFLCQFALHFEFNLILGLLVLLIAIFFWSDFEYIQVQFTVNFDGFHAHFFGVLFHSLPFSSFDQHQIQSNRSQFEFFFGGNWWIFHREFSLLSAIFSFTLVHFASDTLTAFNYDWTLI